MLDPDAAALLERIRSETARGRLVWTEDDDGYFVARFGPEEQPILIRRMFLEATNQIGADPYFVELSMPGWNTRFAITDDSDGWRAVRAILDAAFPQGWPGGATQALRLLEFKLGLSDDPVGPKVAVHSTSEPGGHPENEDAHLVQTHPTDPDCWVVCVADGQGGQAGGAEASRIACDAVMRAARGTPVHQLAVPDTWETLLEAADRAVAAEDVAGFTTLVGFALVGGRVVGASCGDSAAVLLNTDGTTLLTDRQGKNPPVGSGAAGFTSFESDLGESWRVLAMTDGVWKPVGWPGVFDALRDEPDGPALLDRLRDRARLPRTGALSDDFTAVSLRPTVGGA